MEQVNGNNMEINNRLDKIEQTLERLEAAILGDKFNDNGYKKRMELAEKRLDKLEDARKREEWITTFFKYASGAIVGAAAVKIFEQLIK